jgi:uncharacterized protein (UPF0333 family)
MMNLLPLITAILIIIIILKLLNKLFKLALFLLFSIFILSIVLGYLVVKDFRSMDDQKIAFLDESENLTTLVSKGLADRYVHFLGTNTTNLSNSQIIRYYWGEKVEVYPETILFRAVKLLR